MTPLDTDPLTVPDELWDPEAGAWVPRPSVLWALFLGVGIGLVFGVVVTASVLAARPETASEPDRNNPANPIARTAGKNGPSASRAVSQPADHDTVVKSLPTQDPGEIGSAIESGIASYVNPGLGSRYLALPGGPGIRVTICGQESGRCVDRVSTDAGPDLAMQRAGRVADVSYSDFGLLCQCHPPDVGLLPVTVQYAPGNPTPPATEAEP